MSLARRVLLVRHARALLALLHIPALAIAAYRLRAGKKWEDRFTGSARPTLEAAVARVDITPQPGLPLQGYGSGGRTATGVRDPLD